jgi:hypothetical protein
VESASEPGATPTDDGGSSTGKWIAGIAATVIGGVLVWWLTSAGGPFDPQSPEIGIAALSPTPVVNVGQAASAGLTVRNDGDAAARRCKVLWSPFSENPNDSRYPATTEFSLDADASRDFTLRTASRYLVRGEIPMAAQVTCEETDSAVVTDSVTVR